MTFRKITKCVTKIKGDIAFTNSMVAMSLCFVRMLIIVKNVSGVLNVR